MSRGARIGVRALGIVALWLLALAPLGARAQEVTGAVVDASMGTGLPGAMVLLVDGADKVVVQALSGRDGVFRLTPSQPGRYRLRVEHIGFENAFSEFFDLAAGPPLVLNVQTAARPIALAGIDVSASRRCEVRPSAGAASVVWEEARKALAAAAWTAERGVYEIVRTRYERDIAATGRRVLEEQRRVDQVRTVQPFVSPNLDTLMERGFVQSSGGSEVFAGPDALVLLSDAFLDTHCFTVERRRDGATSRIGLRFAPIPDRRVPDVQGVMWLDESGGRLRTVEYEYVNLGRELENDAFGELTFSALPNGTWIIEEWRIRVPVLVVDQNQYGEVRGYRTLRWHESGGLVNRVSTNGGQVVSEGSPGHAVRGAVTDSLGRPAAGAHVWIDGASLQALVDSSGTFELPGLGDGIWRLGASTPELDRLGYGGRFVDVDVARSDVQNLRVELPSVGRFARDRCREADVESQLLDGRRHEDTRGIVIGRVVDSSGAPAGAASVRLRWQRFTISADATQIGGTTEERIVPVDERAGFLLCNVPIGLTIQIEASTATRISPLMRVAVPEIHGVEVREVVLSEVREAPAGSGASGAADAPQAIVPSERGLEVIGTLRDSESGNPVAAATVELLAADGSAVRARTITNASGAFRLAAPERGTYRVRAWRLALDTITRGPVELVEGSAVSMSLTTRAHPIELPAVDVAVAARVRMLADEGFYERRQMGAGIYMTPQAIAALNLQRSVDLFRAVPGIRMVDESSGRPVPMTNMGLLWEQRNPPRPAGSASRNSPRSCLPMIYLDGGLVQAGGEDETGARIFDLSTFPASQLLAVEVYRGPAETPARFNGAFANCGVIVIWTNQRLPVPPPPEH
jgi:hypothetical protein